MPSKLLDESYFTLDDWNNFQTYPTSEVMCLTGTHQVKIYRHAPALDEEKVLGILGFRIYELIVYDRYVPKFEIEEKTLQDIFFRSALIVEKRIIDRMLDRFMTIHKKIQTELDYQNYVKFYKQGAVQEKVKVFGFEEYLGDRHVGRLISYYKKSKP